MRWSGQELKLDFLRVFVNFYVTAVTKILAKFPFDDSTLKELAFLDPRNQDQSSSAGLSRLATRFATFTNDKMDSLEMEFGDFCASLHSELPEYNPHISSAIDKFWSAMLISH